MHFPVLYKSTHAAERLLTNWHERNLSTTMSRQILPMAVIQERNQVSPQGTPAATRQVEAKTPLPHGQLAAPPPVHAQAAPVNTQAAPPAHAQKAPVNVVAFPAHAQRAGALKVHLPPHRQAVGPPQALFVPPHHLPPHQVGLDPYAFVTLHNQFLTALSTNHAQEMQAKTVEIAALQSRVDDLTKSLEGEKDLRETVMAKMFSLSRW